VPGGDNFSPAQPCPPFMGTHPYQPPTLAHTLSTKSSNLSTLALFWTINSLCTSLLLKPYDVQAPALAVSYSLRYDKNSSQLTPTPNLGLWKTIVLPHFFQNLRYIQSETDIKKMQTSLNLSLARVLHVYGDHTELLADTGIPPLQLTKYVCLAQLHFRLTITRPDTLPALLRHI